jgi:hypothetical protein
MELMGTEGMTLHTTAEKWNFTALGWFDPNSGDKKLPGLCNEYCCSRWVYLKDVRRKKYKMFHQAILLEVRYLGLRLLNKLIGLFDVHLASQQLAFI